jgi:hypothetical protein
MKNILHFGKIKFVSAAEINQPRDSGNGFYSYSYYLLPFSGKYEGIAVSNVSNILFKKHYRPPFGSLGDIRLHSETLFGGELLVQTVYHHGD